MAKSGRYSCARVSLYLLPLVLVFFGFVQALWAENLAQEIEKELGARPAKAELVRFLKNHAPDSVDADPEELIIPKKYIAILFGQKVADFVAMAQDSNSFLNPEAGKLGFMNTDEIEYMNEWAFNPSQGNAFLIGRIVLPANKAQIGYVADEEDIEIPITMQISGRDRSKVNFWIHPDQPEKYRDIVEGGARGVPKNGYKIHWDFVGVLPSGPRSALVMNLNKPDLPPIEVKVNLHMTMDSGLRVIVPEKAARSVLASELFEDNLGPTAQERWGEKFLPEVGAWALPFTHRSNVVRDPSLLFTRGTDYVYGYTPFSPIKGHPLEDIMAQNWMGRRPTKTKFQEMARKVFSLVARPFAYNSLVTGLNLEWHSANFLFATKNGKLGDHVIVKDMEAIRADIMTMIRNGGDASALQKYHEPFSTAKFSDAMGGNWEKRYVGRKIYELQAPAFLSKQYLLHVRGLKFSRSSTAQTTEDNTWGFSNIVDMVRNFGVGVMGFNLTNPEVERWMDEEMAAAFEEVLRKELRIPYEAVPEVTAEQILKEVQLTAGYSAVVWDVPEKIPVLVHDVWDRIQRLGGMSRALVQLRQYYDSQITPKDADKNLYELLVNEAERLQELHRNTRIEWYNLHKEGIYFIFHEKSRMIEARNEDGWLGFFSMEMDGTAGSKRFFKKFKDIKGRYPQGVTGRMLKKCGELLKSNDVYKRGSFGDRL